jgi:hypothetical protein
MRWMGRQPVDAARFRFPAADLSLDDRDWCWTVNRGSRLTVKAEQSSPRLGPGPSLGAWPATVRYFRQRKKGYAVGPAGLSRLTLEQPAAAIWPVTAELDDHALVAECLPLCGTLELPALHSSWICPEMPFKVELDRLTQKAAMVKSATKVATDAALPASRRADPEPACRRTIAALPLCYDRDSVHYASQ